MRNLRQYWAKSIYFKIHDKLKATFIVISNFKNIITNTLDNIHTNESHNYLKEENKKECQEETIKNKQTDHWQVFKVKIKVKKTNENSFNLKMTFLRQFCFKKFTNKYKLKHAKDIKIHNIFIYQPKI